MLLFAREKQPEFFYVLHTQICSSHVAHIYVDKQTFAIHIQFWKKKVIGIYIYSVELSENLFSIWKEELSYSLLINLCVCVSFYLYLFSSIPKQTITKICIVNIHLKNTKVSVFFWCVFCFLSNWEVAWYGVNWISRRPGMPNEWNEMKERVRAYHGHK